MYFDTISNSSCAFSVPLYTTFCVKHLLPKGQNYLFLYCYEGVIMIRSITSLHQLISVLLYRLKHLVNAAITDIERILDKHFLKLVRFREVVIDYIDKHLHTRLYSLVEGKIKPIYVSSLKWLHTWVVLLVTQIRSMITPFFNATANVTSANHRCAEIKAVYLLLLTTWNDSKLVNQNVSWIDFLSKSLLNSITEIKISQNSFMSIYF